MRDKPQTHNTHENSGDSLRKGSRTPLPPNTSKSSEKQEQSKNRAKYSQYVMRPLKAMRKALRSVWRGFVVVVNWLDDKGPFVTAVATVLIAFLTAAYVHYSRAQWNTMEKQLRVSYLDIRPWIYVTSDATPVTLGGDARTQIHLKNRGKTPAEKVMAMFAIEKVKNGMLPNFIQHGENGNENVTYSPPVIASFTIRGIMPPSDNSPENPADPLMVIWPPDKHAITKEEFEELITGRSYLAVHGRVTYVDRLEVFHWTQFCTYVALPGLQLSTDSGMGCANYNHSDKN